jgi:ABC-2 type transport system permease protein
MTRSWPTWAQSVVRQGKAQTLVFWRTPVAAFFTLFLPLIMLVLFNALFDGDVETDAGSFKISQFYTAGLAAFAAVSATYTNLVNMIPIRRDEGILKRVRSTPLQPSAYIGGLVLSAVGIAIVGTLIMLLLGVVFYDLQIEMAKMPAASVTFVVALTSFSLLGLAVASLVPNASSAPAVANATILPLAFISNVFIPLEDPPRWLEVVGDIFPLKPFAEAFQVAFNPLEDAPAFRWGNLAVVAAWGVVGGVIALKKFNWEPSVGGSGGRRSRRGRRASSDLVNLG